MMHERWVNVLLMQLTRDAPGRSVPLVRLEEGQFPAGEAAWRCMFPPCVEQIRQQKIVLTVKVPLSQPCFDHFFGPCFRGHDEAGLLAFSMSLFSDVGPLEAIAENKTEQKSAAKRRQRLLKAPLKPPSYDARFPTARSV